LRQPPCAAERRLKGCGRRRGINGWGRRDRVAEPHGPAGGRPYLTRAGPLSRACVQPRRRTVNPVASRRRGLVRPSPHTKPK
jgi:hypothetical protein